MPVLDQNDTFFAMPKTQSGGNVKLYIDGFRLTGQSKFMDKPVVGSIGGSVLRNFAVTVDYRAERAYFERL